MMRKIRKKEENKIEEIKKNYKLYQLRSYEVKWLKQSS